MSTAADRCVLVTGAAGFLGRHAARRFAADGHLVIGLGHGAMGRGLATAWGLSGWHTGDVDLATLRGLGVRPSIIVHCAGGALVGASFRDPFGDFQRTVATTAAVLEFMRLEAPGARLLLPSSAAVYGAAARLPIAEDAALAPVSPYGAHKLAAEEVCRSHARHFGASVAIVRFFSLYGPHLRKQLLWDACGKLVRGETSFDGTGRELRDWLHVDDAVELLVLAAVRASSACPTANGGTGAGTPINAVIGHLATALGSVPPTFSAAARSGDPQAYVAAMDVARSWGFRPAVEWRTGVLDYARWFHGRDAAGRDG